MLFSISISSTKILAISLSFEVDMYSRNLPYLLIADNSLSFISSTILLKKYIEDVIKISTRVDSNHLIFLPVFRF